MNGNSKIQQSETKPQEHVKEPVDWEEVAEQQGLLDVKERQECIARVLACFDRPLIEALAPLLKIAFDAGVDVTMAATLAEVEVTLPEQRRVYEAVAQIGLHYPDPNECMPKGLRFSDAFHAGMLLKHANPVRKTRPNEKKILGR